MAKKPTPTDPADQAAEPTTAAAPVEASQPEASPAPEPIVKRYAISLPHTCGEGTIRPPFEVVIAMTGEAGSGQVLQMLDQQKPNAGVKVTLPRPTDLFAAGEQARLKAIEMFNRHYHILGTEHDYTVQPVEKEPQASAA